jgi:hypothetical protein
MSETDNYYLQAALRILGPDSHSAPDGVFLSAAQKIIDGGVVSEAALADALAGIPPPRNFIVDPIEVDELLAGAVTMSKLSAEVIEAIEGGGSGGVLENSIGVSHLLKPQGDPYGGLNFNNVIPLLDSTGQYFIGRPDLWPDNATPVNFGGGVLGYKKTGTFNTNSGSNGVVVLLSASAADTSKHNVFSYGGWFRTDQNEVQMIPSSYNGAGAVPTSIALLRADIGGLFLITRTNASRSNQPYMVWWLTMGNVAI